MKQETVALRCQCNAETVVFTKFVYKDGDIDYDISVEDSYTGGDYKGLFGRFKRAWKAFWDKPVVYTGVYCEDEHKIRQFLYECLDLVNDSHDTSVTSNEELIKKGEW